MAYFESDLNRQLFCFIVCDWKLGLREFSQLLWNANVNLTWLSFKSITNHYQWDGFELDPTVSEKQFLYSKFM